MCRRPVPIALHTEAFINSPARRGETGVQYYMSMLGLRLTMPAQTTSHAQRGAFHGVLPYRVFDAAVEADASTRGSLCTDKAIHTRQLTCSQLKSRDT